MVHYGKAEYQQVLINQDGRLKCIPERCICLKNITYIMGPFWVLQAYMGYRLSTAGG